MKRTGEIKRRTPMKKKSGKKKQRPAKPCVYNTRCKTRPTVEINDVERYCKTHAKLVADQWVGVAVKDRDRWTCQRCSKRASNGVTEIQYAHVISRGARFIQYEMDNAMALCRDCHYYFTIRPAQWSVFLATTRPGLHDRLSLLEAERERAGVKVDLAAIIIEHRKVAA